MQVAACRLPDGQLTTGNWQRDVEWIFVKDCDVPVYVEHGAADVGVAGLDQIIEHDCSAYQPVEFDFGRCRMMLIAAPGAPPLTKIATKYPRMARQYLESRGLRAEIVPLGGSVELAAVLALTSHVIDLVESGETVRVHKLEIQDLVAEISPRLIVGRNAYRTKTREIRDLILRHDVTLERAFMYLRERVMERFAVAEGLVQRRIEPIQEAELEVVGALEVVLEVREREDHVRNAGAWLRG